MTRDYIRCPICKSFVQTQDGRIAAHTKVRLTGNKLQRATCAGSGMELNEER